MQINELKEYDFVKSISIEYATNSSYQCNVMIMLQKEPFADSGVVLTAYNATKIVIPDNKILQISSIHIEDISSLGWEIEKIKISNQEQDNDFEILCHSYSLDSCPPS